MDEIKILNHERECGKGSFPGFKHLSAGEARELKDSLAIKLGSRDATGAELVSAIANSVDSVASMDESGLAFDLIELLRTQHFDLCERIYLNWYHFDDLDEMALIDLAEHFESIWYAGADDLDVYAPSAGWILSIHHSGEIGALRLPIVSQIKPV